ncbi:MAG: Asp-tRNA(Asn)/Glu-tRNA(Gln) amidotransferase subunit GatB, partial [Gemmatimonadota bacterium]
MSDAVIGLEIHVQLDTRTKMFCADRNEFGGEPNTRVCPVCLGLPGALPVTNERAVALGVRTALGLSCTVHPVSVFARKNYFYPDLPKGYQITQYDRPLATDGWLDVNGERVRIRRVHLEEDAGKSLHDRVPDLTAVDLNRAGVPLVEIVTEPDLTSPGQTREFLKHLKQLLEYLGVSDCDMEKGSLRVDANVSLAGEASSTRSELKNMNSFANVERALLFEIGRRSQIQAVGGRLSAATLLWDADRGEARPIRAKEESDDYRYFPEPDLPPLVLEQAAIDEARSRLPELPAARRARFRDTYGLPEYDADVLTSTRDVADYFEAVAGAAGDAKAASNWVMTEVLAWLNRSRTPLSDLPVPAERLAELIRLVGRGTVSNTAARQVFEQMLSTGRSAADIVEAEGLAQVRDAQRLEDWAEAVLAAHPDVAERYRQGEDKLLGFLMGQLMRMSDGRADPARASRILRE